MDVDLRERWKMRCRLGGACPHFRDLQVDVEDERCREEDGGGEPAPTVSRSADRWPSWRGLLARDDPTER